MAENMVGKAEASATLTVHGKLEHSYKSEFHTVLLDESIIHGPLDSCSKFISILGICTA